MLKIWSIVSVEILFAARGSGHDEKIPTQLTCLQKQQQQAAANAEGGGQKKKKVTAAQLRVQKGEDALFCNVVVQLLGRPR